MYAIIESAGRGVGITSRDQCQNWWDGKAWTPCSDRAKVYEDRDDAEKAMEDLPCDGRIVDAD